MYILVPAESMARLMNLTVILGGLELFVYESHGDGGKYCPKH